MSKQTPTVFEILAQQYRDWCTSTCGAEHGLPTANDALASAGVARVRVKQSPACLEVGDYILVWPRGHEIGPDTKIGSKPVRAYVGWVPSCGVELIHGVQKFADVIWMHDARDLETDPDAHVDDDIPNGLDMRADDLLDAREED